MGRKKVGILDLLVELPWWVSVVFSGAIYFTLKWVIPGVQFKSIIFQSFAHALPNMAGYFAFILLLPAPISALNSWRKKRLLDDQKGIESIRRLSWKELEELVGEIFRRKGFTVIENSGAGPDGGIDVALKKDGQLFLVQCKQWKAQKVDVRVVREMYGVMTAHQAKGVIIITSGFFTQEAQTFALGKPIELIDGSQLAPLVEGVRRTERKPFHSSVATPPKPANVCPQCGSRLVLRTARKGQSAGNRFYGCSSYPRCRFTKAY